MPRIYTFKYKREYDINGNITGKECSKCKTIKPMSSFCKNKSVKIGYASACKDCFLLAARAYKLTKTGKAFRKAAKMRANKKAKIRNRKFVLEYFATHHCVDCGDERWQVKEFDHIKSNKIGTICRMVNVGCSLKKLIAEIAKCEVRCVNCHRIKTHRQFGYFSYLDGDDVKLSLID